MVGGMFSLLRSLTMCKISSYSFESSDEPLRGLHDHLEAGVSCHRAGMHTVVAASDYFWLGVFINNYLEAHSTISQGCAGGSRSFRKVLVEHNSISPSNCHIQHSYNLLFFSKYEHSVQTRESGAAIGRLPCPLLAAPTARVTQATLWSFLQTSLSVQTFSGRPDLTGLAELCSGCPPPDGMCSLTSLRRMLVTDRLSQGIQPQIARLLWSCRSKCRSLLLVRML